MGRRRRPPEADDEFTERTTTTAVYAAGGGEGRPAPFQPAFILRLTRGPGAPADITLTDDLLVIGRSQSCGIFVDSPELSRNHVQLEKQGHEYTLTDLESRNGVFLNGVRIHSAVLRSGDTLQMGNVTFLYLEGF